VKRLLMDVTTPRSSLPVMTYLLAPDTHSTSTSDPTPLQHKTGMCCMHETEICTKYQCMRYTCAHAGSCIQDTYMSMQQQTVSMGKRQQACSSQHAHGCL